jgi:hypothetical protein
MLGANKETASLCSAHRFREVFAKKNRAWTRRWGFIIDLRMWARKEETENNEQEHSQGPEKEEQETEERGGREENRHTSGNDSEDNYRAGRRTRTFIIVLFNKSVKNNNPGCLDRWPLGLDLTTTGGATIPSSSPKGQQPTMCDASHQVLAIVIAKSRTWNFDPMSRTTRKE